MKKAIINYSKSIWFKLMNDQMTRGEAILLFLILGGIVWLLLDIYI
jgi:hypothetical protein